MSLLKNIKQQTQQILIKNTSTQSINLQALQSQLLSVIPTLQPTSIYPNLHQVQQKQSQLVYVSLTVQDILDTQFYYAYMINKPITKDSKIYTYKYGIGDQIKQQGNIDIDNYYTIMDNRDTIVCVSQFYGNKWMYQQQNGPIHINKTVDVKISGNYNYKLGQKIYAVCVWNPIDKYLTFVRAATQQQILKQKLNYEETILKQQINFMQTRQLLQQNLYKFCSKQQSQMILFSMISEQPLFINSHNITQQLSQILPRVNHLKIKAPFKQSLFPYKNQQGKLIQTPMQMSLEKTYVIIDFSQFSNQKEIKIGQEEIDNLKALKMFVEEGKTVYRWEFGESLNDHIHSGIIVKGSKIINPHFYIGEQLIEKNKSNINPFKTMDAINKHKIRAYIQKCLKIKPILTEDSRNKIEIEIKSEMQKFPQKKLMIQQSMQLARLHAKSRGVEIIEFQDYIAAKKILNI